MKLLLSILLSFSASALDVACVGWAMEGATSGGRVLAAISAHVGVAAIAAAALLLSPPRSATRQPGWYAIFSFALAFFVPVAGPIGLQFVVRAGLGAKPREADDPWSTLELDERLAEQRVAVKRRGVSATKLASILGRRAPEEAERRFQAILQVKHLPPNQQVQVLKFALKDSSDEVRLFAFSRIEKFRSDLEARIKQFSTDLSTSHADDRALLHLRLAESFHEIAYLQLAEGAVLTHALEQAHTNVLAAKELRPQSGPADYLLGRILLRLGQYEPSIKSFQSAVRQHYPRAKVIPYMAECAFRQRRFDLVRTMMAEMTRITGDSNAVQALVEFWR
jgi:polysaccharide biosynthesis protein PelE